MSGGAVSRNLEGTNNFEIQFKTGIHRMSEPTAPSELVIIDFHGNKFNGEVAPALIDMVDKGLIRIIDLALISRDSDGTCAFLEVTDFKEDVAQAMVKLCGDELGMLSAADLEEMSDQVPADSTCLIVLFEHLWSAAFAKAVVASGGELVLSERIPGAVIDAARETLLEVADQV